MINWTIFLRYQKKGKTFFVTHVRSSFRKSKYYVKCAHVLVKCYVHKSLDTIGNKIRICTDAPDTCITGRRRQSGDYDRRRRKVKVIELIGKHDREGIVDRKLHPQVG